jgi:hypothetical protein
MLLSEGQMNDFKGAALMLPAPVAAALRLVCGTQSQRRRAPGKIAPVRRPHPIIGASAHPALG